ncbi:nucleotidyltransferase domain-containing protein [Mitsuaria sp. 7]|uniref:nucleotidyltransferase domain-containing protein n=1 Tax=Mitsuaria sp. 7 TaxID=1658665 RepID=UPI0007DD5B29|nr:nucleotidyltransferase domain-containing protein [Mitsuaria sp. 7]ANH66730.1 hypothetical protein ABE85_02575 [Mitsuaria sp. 7]
MDEQDILEFSRTHYPGFEFVLHFGSTAHGMAREHSDIDLVLVFPEAIHPFRETRRWRGHLFDSWLYDIESLNGLIHAGRTGRNHVMLDIVLTSRVLPLPTPRSDLLKTAAQRIRKAGPLLADRNDFRHVLTSLMDDLKQCDDPVEGTAVALDLHNVVQQILLSLLGAGGFRKSHAISRLRNHDPVYFSELTNAMALAVQGKHDPLLTAAGRLLAQLGGPLREGHRAALEGTIRMPLPVI